MNKQYKNSNKPSKKSRYRQGYYICENPEKYTGDPVQIIYRSSYEYKFCRYCDLTEEVVTWSSEPFSIKYYDPISKKHRNYNIDFYIKVAGNGTIANYLVEVKPKSKLVAPVLKTRATLKSLKRYNKEMEEFIINNAKKEAAEEYSHAMGYKYLIITEDFLYQNAK